MPNEIEQLIHDFLASPDHDKTYAVGKKLEELATQLAEYVPQLARGLSFPDRDTRLQTALLLRKIGTPAAGVVPQLIERLQDPKEEVNVRRAAANAMGFARGDGLQSLYRLANDSDPLVRKESLAALDLTDYNNAIDVFIEHFADPSHEIRYYMADLLPTSGRHHNLQVTLNRLLEKFDSVPELGKPYIAEAIWKLDPNSQVPLPAVLAIMAKHDQPPEMLRQCCGALAEIGDWTRDVARAVAGLICHKKRDVQEAAVQALSILDVDKDDDRVKLRPFVVDALPEMIQVLKKPKKHSVREKICYVLIHLGPAAAPAVHALAGIFAEEKVDTDLQLAVAAALCSIGPAVSEVRTILEDVLKNEVMFTKEGEEFIQSALSQIKRKPRSPLFSIFAWIRSFFGR